MRRATQWRPWQFSLRFLLLATTVIAAVLGWWAHRAQRQRRAVAAIRELGGTVEYALCGPKWLRQLIRDESLQEVVSVELPGHLADQADLRGFHSLRTLKLTYVTDWHYDVTKTPVLAKCYLIDKKYLPPAAEDPRLNRLKLALPRVKVVVTETPIVHRRDGYVFDVF